MPPPNTLTTTPMSFVLLDTPQFEAFAAIWKGHGYVLVSCGAILILQDVFHRILSRPDTFPLMGNPSVEVLQPQHCNGIEWDYEITATKRGGGIDAVTPRDPDRRHQSNMLLTHAFNFIVRHEIAHVAMGHVDYRSARHGISLVSEMRMQGGQPATAEELLEIQAMEFQADWFATTQSVNTEIFLEPHLPPGWLQQAFPNSRTGPYGEWAAFNWVFAVASLFLIFNDDFDPTTVLQHEHPPAIMRANDVVRWIAGPSATPPPPEIRPYRQRFIDGIRSAVNCFRQLGALPRARDGFFTDMFKEGFFEWHGVQLEIASRRLQNKLVPFDRRILRTPPGLISEPKPPTPDGTQPGLG